MKKNGRLAQFACLILAISLLSTASAVAQVVNGDFEGGSTDPWKIGWHNNPAVCYEPFRATPFNLPYPPGPTTDSRHLLWLGNQIPALEQHPGCDASGAYQWFDCGTGGDYCTVTFDYEFHQDDIDDDAVIFLKSSGGTTYKYLPPATGPAGENIKVSVPGCGTNVIVLFAVLDDYSDGIQSKMLLDNVTSACTTASETTLGLVGYTDALPFDIDNPPDNPLEDRTIPIPAVTEWGIVVMILLLLSTATVVLMRRRAATV